VEMRTNALDLTRLRGHQANSKLIVGVEVSRFGRQRNRRSGRGGYSVPSSKMMAKSNVEKKRRGHAVRANFEPRNLASADAVNF